MNIIKELISRLNARMIHPEKDVDLLLRELKSILEIYKQDRNKAEEMIENFNYNFNI